MAAQQNLPEVLVIDNGTAFESGLRGGDSRVTVTTSSVGAIGGILPLGRTGYLRSDLVQRYAAYAPPNAAGGSALATNEELTRSLNGATAQIETLQREIELQTACLASAGSNEPAAVGIDLGYKEQRDMLRGELERTGNMLLAERKMTVELQDRLESATAELNAAKAQHIVTTGQLAQAEATLAGFNAKAKEDTQPEHPAG